MTEETSTVELYKWQKEWLDEFKEPGQSYKGAMESLIEVYGQHEFQAIGSHSDGDDTEVVEQPQIDGQEVAREVAQQLIDDLVSQLPPKIAEELQQ